MGIAAAFIVGTAIGYIFRSLLRAGEVDEAWYDGARVGFDLGSKYERMKYESSIQDKHDRSIDGR